MLHLRGRVRSCLVMSEINPHLKVTLNHQIVLFDRLNKTSWCNKLQLSVLYIFREKNRELQSKEVQQNYSFKLFLLKFSKTIYFNRMFDISNEGPWCTEYTGKNPWLFLMATDVQQLWWFWYFLLALDVTESAVLLHPPYTALDDRKTNKDTTM